MNGSFSSRKGNHVYSKNAERAELLRSNVEMTVDFRFVYETDALCTYITGAQKCIQQNKTSLTHRNDFLLDAMGLRNG